MSQGDAAKPPESHAILNRRSEEIAFLRISQSVNSRFKRQPPNLIDLRVYGLDGFTSFHAPKMNDFPAPVGFIANRSQKLMCGNGAASLFNGLS
jgi:hypothetical protein